MNQQASTWSRCVVQALVHPTDEGWTRTLTLQASTDYTAGGYASPGSSALWSVILKTSAW